MIMVFGSNLKGNHGGGAALAAKLYYRAKEGVGIGITGNSYALPTKKTINESLPLKQVKRYIEDFILWAEEHPNDEFKVTRVGCLRAGFTDHQIAPLFKNAPGNCYFDTAWQAYLPVTAKFWGTY